MKFTIITPTFKRNPFILQRCIHSVNSQIEQDWFHLIVVDDVSLEPHVSTEFVNTYSNSKRKFVCLGFNSNNYGNSPRQFAIEQTNSDFIVFLDDDNIMFPSYLQTVNTYLKPNVDMAICQIVHMGPLPAKFGPPPKILDGNPPVLQNIDTLQVTVKTEMMKKYTWLDKGYMADGYTIQNLAQHCTFVYVPEILGIHM